MGKQEIVTKVVQKVVQTVAQVQKVSGRSKAGIGAPRVRPGGEGGFDSLSGVEATVMLWESLRIDLPEDYNPFISNPSFPKMGSGRYGFAR